MAKKSRKTPRSKKSKDKELAKFIHLLKERKG